MANDTNDTQPSGSQLLGSFQEEVEIARSHTQRRADQLLAKTGAYEDVPDLSSPQKMEEHYDVSNLEMTKAVRKLLATDGGIPGTIGGMQMTAAQGDFMQVRRRAATLRNTSFARRVVQTASRRNRYAEPENGYLDRRIVRNIINITIETMSADASDSNTQ